LPQRIKFEIDRAAATDQDFILALISIDNYSSLSNRDAIYARIARLLLEEFTFQDLAFEYKEGSYALIVPDTDLDTGISRLELFQNRIGSEEDLKGSVTLCVGLSSRNGRLVNGANLLTESLNALKRAQSQGRGSLIAFRADPEKYRDYISKKA
jgi:GGDEF domain-containing protein